jgi:hypothetical protein
MDEPLLTLSDAARRLEVPLEELTRAVVHRRIDFKLVDGSPTSRWKPWSVTSELPDHSTVDRFPAICRRPSRSVG